jgi:hypothetical protein
MKKAPIVTKNSHSLLARWTSRGGLLGAHLSMVAAEEPAKPEKLNPYTGNAEAIQEGRALFFRMAALPATVPAAAVAWAQPSSMTNGNLAVMISPC